MYEDNGFIDVEANNVADGLEKVWNMIDDTDNPLDPDNDAITWNGQEYLPMTFIPTGNVDTVYE